mgnify:CR=1 FL=1
MPLIELHFHIRPPDDMEARLDQILFLLHTSLFKESIIMTDLTALTAQVQANTDIEQSAILLIKGLADQIAAAGSDPIAIADLVTKLKVSATALAAAIAANTPVAPPPA